MSVLNQMDQSLQGAKYNRYMFGISIIERIFCVASATCYLQHIMHQIHLHSDFHGEPQLQTRACCPTCMRNAECPVTGVFKSAQERPNSVPINFNRHQEQYWVLLKVLCVLSTVESLGSTFHSLIHTPRALIRAMSSTITSFVTLSTRWFKKHC